MTEQTGIRRYRRKPRPVYEEEASVVKYEPGQPLDALIKVARMYDDDAELAEAVLPSGPVLLVRYTNMEGDRSFRDWKVIEPGGYLAFGNCLFDTTEDQLQYWYELVTQPSPFSATEEGADR